VKGASVPPQRVTLYCSGVSCACHSVSDLAVFFGFFTYLPASFISIRVQRYMTLAF
jgi:hypothetical protein